MAYNGSTRNGKKSSNLEKHLRLEDRLSSDKKPVKIGDEVSGLLLNGKDVHIEEDLTVGGDSTIGGDLAVNGGDITTNSDMTLNSDGTINLDTKLGNIYLKLDGASLGSFDLNTVSTLKLQSGSNNHLNLISQGTGNVVIDSNANITLDSHTGVFIAKNAGTEFSAANSAYAGMILGYTRLQGDLTNQSSFEVQNSMTVEDSTHQITFTTPPSENVELEVSCVMNIGSTDTEIDIGVSDSSTYNSIGAQFEYDGAGVIFSDDEADDHIIVAKFILGASELASIGSSNTFYIGFSTAGATKTAFIIYGLRASHGICDHPFTIKATALPATIYDGQ